MTEPAREKNKHEYTHITGCLTTRSQRRKSVKVMQDDASKGKWRQCRHRLSVHRKTDQVFTWQKINGFDGFNNGPSEVSYVKGRSRCWHRGMTGKAFTKGSQNQLHTTDRQGPNNNDLRSSNPHPTAINDRDGSKGFEPLYLPTNNEYLPEPPLFLRGKKEEEGKGAEEGKREEPP